MSCADVQTIQAGNGVKTQFSFDFPYLFKSEIQVSFWNATTKEWDVKAQDDATYPWQLTDANPTIIEFTSTAPPSPAVPVDPGESSVDNVRIRRVTNIDDIRALFNPGSAIRSDDLNKNFEQLRYAIQEANCQGISDDVYQYLLDNYWDRFDNTLYAADAWVSDDTKIATTAALDQRFLDEVNETQESTEAWVSDDTRVPTTAATDARFVDVLNNETIAGTKTFSSSPVVPTPANGTDATNKTYVDTEINDKINDALTTDIGTDGTGVTVTDDGDGTITLGIGANSVDLDRIKDEDLLTYAEEVAGSPTWDSDNRVPTTYAALQRFDTIVQTTTPSGSDWSVGKTWLQSDSDRTLSIWNGSAWLGVSSGGTFTSQPKVVYVDSLNGDDANDGHRISRPKQTIKAAINQINSEVDIDLTSGGSGYVEDEYLTVSLTGGTGSGLTADITVNASGVVTTVSLNNPSVLENSYSIGDVLSANNADLGGSGSGLQITVTGTGDGQVVVVAPGVYQEVAPIQIKRRDVSVIGQALRSCVIHPTVATETNSMFQVNSGSYIANLTFTGIKASGTRGASGSVDPDATYGLPPVQGWNVSFYPGATVVKSPYIQNCTNFSDSEIDNSDLNAHRPAGGSAGDTDSQPTGGGLLVDGSVVSSNSPLRSIVCDSYTHVGLDGPAILVTNNGYCQATSSYAFFCHYHIKCLNGGQANLAASTTDFGRYSLVTDGKSTTAIFTADLSTNASDGDITFTIDAPVADASWHGSATRPQSNMVVQLNSIIYPVLSATPNGTGWDVTISRPNPSNKSENLGLDGAVTTPAVASFYLRSMIASSGHTMEYVGSGTNYSALPENGGVPDDTAQVIELNNGKVWTAITDHNGKFTVGPLEVDQRTGAITIAAGASVTNVVDDPSPQLGGDLDANGFNIILTGGSAANPSLRFTADADTGLYSPGGNQIGLSAGGNVVATFDEFGVAEFPGLVSTSVLFSESINLPSDTNWTIELLAPAGMAAAVSYTLPGVDGTSGQLLSTDGSGTLSWTNDVGVLVTDGGNFDNGSSTVSTSQTLDGGSF